MVPTRVLLAFLNTGGGHRSVALAVLEALHEQYGGEVHVDAVDVTAERFNWPLSQLDTVYNWLVHLRGLPWALTYHATNGARRMAVVNAGWWLLTRRSIQGMLRHCPTDVIVCCHPLLKGPMVRALQIQRQRTPLITLVTDLATGHAAWFRPRGGKCLVATERARQRAMAYGLAPDKVEVTGLPVRASFLHATESRAAMRRKLGLRRDKPVVLLLNGANGMGPFHSLVRTVVSACPQAHCVAIAGRNRRLRAKLTSQRWTERVEIKGFVENVHQWMAAADLLVTKAGPATVAEALVAGVPMILSGAVPGQEPPNASYVEEIGAGVWAPGPVQAAEAVRVLLSAHDGKLQEMRSRARDAVRPDAARRVAEIVWSSAREGTAVDKNHQLAD